jgi:hypothetical protein
MRQAVYVALVALIVLHQDFWLWNDSSLLFDFLPAGLAYHMLYSIVAAFVWGLALLCAWPEDAETFAQEETPQDQPK